jgi:hypothetical protein
VENNIMTEKAQQIKDVLNKVYVDRDELTKLYIDKQGYAFDSLVYRFKDYQARAFRAEVLQMKHDRNLTELEASQRVKDRHDRDLMRFIQILDEAIGEHN